MLEEQSQLRNTAAVERDPYEMQPQIALFTEPFFAAVSGQHPELQL